MSLFMQRLPYYCAFIILAFAIFIGTKLFSHAPVMEKVSSITIKKGTADIIIGQPELGQRLGTGRTAALDHLRVQYIADDWWLSNISSNRKVDVPGTLFKTRHLQRWLIQPGDIVSLGDDKLLTVESIGAESFSLRADDTVWHWQAGSLRNDLQWASGCADVYGAVPDWRWKAKQIEVPVRKFFDRSAPEVRALRIGGQVNCPQVASMKKLPWDALRVVWLEGHFWFAPGKADPSVAFRRRADSASQTIVFKDMRLPLSGVGAETQNAGKHEIKQVVLGRNTLNIKALANGDLLLTNPEGDLWPINIASEVEPQSLNGTSEDNFYERPKARDATGLSINWSNRAAQSSSDKNAPANGIATRVGAGMNMLEWISIDKRLILVVVLILIAWPVALFLLPALVKVLPFQLPLKYSSIKSQCNRWAILSPLPLLFFGLGFCWYLGPGVNESIDLNVFALIVALAWLTMLLLYGVQGRGRGATGFILLCLTALACFGVINQLSFALGGDSLRWQKFANKQLLGVLISVTLLSVLVLLPRTLVTNIWRDWSVPRGRNFHIVMGIIGFIFIAFFAMQYGLGSEEGLFGFIQPVEIAKFALLMLAAWLAAQVQETRWIGGGNYQRNPAFILRFAGPFAALLLIAGIGMGALNDISPIVILLVFSYVLLCWLAPNPAGRKTKGSNLAIAVLTLGFLVIVFGALSLWIKPSLMPDGFPSAERFAVWSQPSEHPHSGEQVIKAMQAVRRGEWFGESGSIPAWNGAVMRIPAVQDDFALAFLLNRYGALAGLALLAVQLLFSLVLFTAAAHLRTQANIVQNGDFRRAAWLWSAFLFGYAAMQLAHWIIGWGNTLGLLPVMGQPMTWLSAGNSHLLGFAVLGLLAAMPALWLFEHIEEEEQYAY